ncbi:MAG: hypothetical protein AAF242_03170, partial [Bacteroidota bacterium]
MQITLSLFDLLIIIGMAKGIICSILLWRKSEKKRSNRFLALGILAFVWLNTKTLLLSLGLWEVHGLGFFPNGIELALSPLFYLYLRALLQPNLKFIKTDWLHFVPFFLSQTYAIVVYVAIMQTTEMAEKQAIASSFYFNEVKLAEEYLTIISALFYLYFGYMVIRDYRKLQAQHKSKDAFAEFSFLRTSIYWLVFILLYNVTNLILNPFLVQPYHWRW